jgi:UDP-N-acetylmuramyl pentapeptide phosphotransferase/UDP-N-acetylglucosamine-1-phosphate transferase
MSFVFVSIVVSGAALMCAYGLVAAIRLWAERRQMLDIPNERSSHTVPTPRGGGLAIAATVLFGLPVSALMVGSFSSRALFTYLVAGVLIAGVGWIDDRRSLSAGFRLGVQIGAAVIAVAGLGYFTGLRLPFGVSLHLGWLGLPLTLIWIMGLTNAYNFMDGIDGLAGGQAVVAGAFWVVVGWRDHLALVAGVGLLTAAASLGFLAHNWPPARIFMGDVGSGFLGCTFALLPVLASPSDPRLPLVGALLVWPFIFDTAFTMLRRLRRRENLLQAHRSHLYQRLVLAGRSHVSVTSLYLGLALLGGLAGVAWALAWPAADVILLVIPMAGLGVWAGVVWSERQAASATIRVREGNSSESQSRR